MNKSIRKDALYATSVVLIASVATAAVAATTSGRAFGASQDYRFEVAQIASAGPGKSDVTIGLVRTADGKVVTDADLAANGAVGTATDRAGYRRFRVGTVTAGPQTLQVSAKVPGPTRIERTFNSSVKFLQTRKVRGPDKVVTGTVTFVVN